MDEIIFSNYGIVIIKRSDKFYLQTEEGQAASIIVEYEISETEAAVAQEGATKAVQLCIRCQNERRARRKVPPDSFSHWPPT